jgi:hypothetical protein
MSVKMKRARLKRHPNPAKRQVAEMQALHAAKAARHKNQEISNLIDFGEKKFGYGSGGPYGPFISGGFREHWPEAMKNRLRKAHAERNALIKEAEGHWKKAGKRKLLHQVIDYTGPIHITKP